MFTKEACRLVLGVFTDLAESAGGEPYGGAGLEPDEFEAQFAATPESPGVVLVTDSIYWFLFFHGLLSTIRMFHEHLIFATL